MVYNISCEFSMMSEVYSVHVHIPSLKSTHIVYTHTHHILQLFI